MTTNTAYLNGGWRNWIRMAMESNGLGGGRNDTKHTRNGNELQHDWNGWQWKAMERAVGGDGTHRAQQQQSKAMI